MEEHKYTLVTVGARKRRIGSVVSIDEAKEIARQAAATASFLFRRRRVPNGEATSLKAGSGRRGWHGFSRELRGEVEAEGAG